MNKEDAIARAMIAKMHADRLAEKLSTYLFLGSLSIMLIGFKITGKIDYTWLQVLSPIWVPPTIGFLISLTFKFKHKLTRS